MPQRIDAGPVVAAVGAVVLFLSLFLSWYEPDVSGWEAFETLDLLLGGVAIAAAMLAAGQLGASLARDVDPRLLPLLGAIALAAVGVTLLQGPPGTEGADTATGTWVALGASVLILAGGALSAARISVTVTFAGRDARRRVPVVDRRDEETTVAEDERHRTQALDVDELLADDRGEAPDDRPPAG
jgi:peptidoglycan/LPS O-acetylase OafA/YrhL